MYHLSDKQIDYILNDIGARGVEMESLQQNLLDHICCIIENNLEENGDFESFYKQTIKTFYKDELWEIEEETIQLLTFKNYYTMKKVMIISGTLSVLGFIAGSIFKIMHWPGAGALLLLSMVTISFVFLPLLFVLKTKEVSAIKDKLMIAIGTLFGILFSLSSLFKIMHWPGANLMWLIALGLLLLVFIPLYFFSGIRNPETKVNTIITTIILIAAGGMLFALTSLKKQESHLFIERHLDNTEIDIFVENEAMIKEEADSLYKLSAEDTSLEKSIYRLNEINAICEELKSNLLESEIGYKKITEDLKHKNIMISNSLVGNLLQANRELYEKKLEELNKLLNDQRLHCWLGKAKTTMKEEPSRKRIMFNSSILFQDFDFILYNNTIIGAYNDISEIQLEAIEDLKEFVLLKQQKKQGLLAGA